MDMWRKTELGSFRLENRKLLKNLTDVYKCLMGGSKDDKARLFSVATSERQVAMGAKLKYRKPHLDVRQNRNGLPREVTRSPSSEMLKNWLDTVLRNLL